MKLLTMDTSTPVCSVALTCGERLVAEQLLNLDTRHSSNLLEAVDTLLKAAGIELADLDGFGVALGPGSFTGVRIAVATAKGLALATGKPVTGFSSLAMLAMNVPLAKYPVCPMFDARKKEVYTGVYRCDGWPEPLVNDCVTSPARLLEGLHGPTIFLGDGALMYRDLISETLGDRAIFAPSTCHYPKASIGALLAKHSFDKGEDISLDRLVPAYIRPSEAELARKAV